MGAGAGACESSSITAVYADSVEWFRTYFLSGECLADYETLIHDADSKVPFADVELWLNN